MLANSLSSAKIQVVWNHANPNSLGKTPGVGVAGSGSASLYALLGEQNSSTRGVAHDHVLPRETRAQADNTRHCGVQGRVALDQDRLAIPGNLENLKSSFGNLHTAGNQTIVQCNGLDGRHTALCRSTFGTLEKGRQVPVFG
jgi:hypothetical protein